MMTHSICKRPAGFTLIEVMVAVVVVAIMASIAYPNFTIYVTKSRMKAGMQFLQELSVSQERYFQTKRVYATTLSDLGIAQVSENVQRDFEPVQLVVNNPTNAINDASARPSYVAVLTPRANGRLRNQFRLAINSEGQKWMESSISCNNNWANRCWRSGDANRPADGTIGTTGQTPSTHPHIYAETNPANINTCNNAAWSWWEGHPEFNRARAGCP